MKEVKYICNMCGETRKKVFDSDISKHEIFELYHGFEAGAKPPRQRYLVQPIKDNCDRHICKRCIRDIIETSPPGITLY